MKTPYTLATWKVATLFVAPLTLAVSGVAFADGPIGTPLSVQIGGGYLSDGTARDTSENVGVHAGISYRLPNKSLLSPIGGKPSIDVDYNHASGHGGHVDALGFTYTERVYVGNALTDVATKGARPYFGVGVGAFRNDVRRQRTVVSPLIATVSHVTSTTPGSTTPGSTTPGSTTPGSTLPGGAAPATTTTQSDNGWSLGGKILAGVDFGNTFVEASYEVSGSKIGVRTDSVNLSVGLHF